MSLTRKVWEGMWTGTAAAILENALRVPRMMIITRVLGPELYGILGVFGMLRETVGMLIQLGTGDAVIRGLAASKAGDRRDRIGATLSAASLIRMVTIGLCILLLFVFEPQVVIFLARYPAVAHVTPGELHWLLRLLLIGVIIQAIEGPFGNALQGFQAWKSLLVVRIIGSFASTGLPIAAALMGFRLLGIVVSQQIAFAVIALAIFHYYVKIVRPILEFPPFQECLREIKPVLAFSLPLILSQLFRLMYNYTDQIMLAGMGSRAEELSYYEVARNAALMLGFVPTLIRTVMFPASAEFFADKNLRRLEALFHFMVKHLFWFLIPFAAWMSALSPQVIAIVAGGKYLPAASALTWLSVMMVMQSFSVPFFTCLVGSFGRTREQFYITVTGGLLNVVLNYLWIPRFGFMGAVYSTACCHVSGFTLACVFLSPHMTLKFPFRFILRAGCCAGIGVIVLYALNQIHPWVALGFCPILYALYLMAMIRLGILDDQDMHYLSRTAPKLSANSWVQRWIMPHVRPTPEDLKL